jgi:hypothetical protein
MSPHGIASLTFLQLLRGNGLGSPTGDDDLIRALGALAIDQRRGNSSSDAK